MYGPARTSILSRHLKPLTRIPVRYMERPSPFLKTLDNRSTFKDYTDALAKKVKSIKPDQLATKLASDKMHFPPLGFYLLDVREPYEWNEEHISGATYTGRGALERDIEKLIPDTNAEIVVYCASGRRSVISADSLTRMGYKNVSYLEGGVREYRGNGPMQENPKGWQEE
ncbi:hypothetical protein HDV00_001467 [Rhizophlyctis rosea]|nr:hypothetical protein HDV00_001467 [Rhizophlyctis rosea]